MSNVVTVTVRRIDYDAPQDRRDLVRLMREYAEFEMGEASPHLQRIPDQLRAFPTAFSVMAFETKAGSAVGLINCLFGFSTFAGRKLVNIHDVIVTESYRGRGVARRMLEEVESIARAEDCCRLTLEVQQDNQPAMKTYRKFGFGGDPLHAGFEAYFWRKSL